MCTLNDWFGFTAVTLLILPMGIILWMFVAMVAKKAWDEWRNK